MNRKIAITILSVFCAIDLALGQVSLDNSTDFNEAPTSLTWVNSFEIPANDNRVLIVGVTYESLIPAGLGQIDSISYNGVRLTKFIDAGFATTSRANECDLWILVAPDAGTNDLTVYYADSTLYPTDVTLMAVALSNAAQVLPSNVGQVLGGSNVSTSLILPQVASKSLVIDMAGHGRNLETLQPDFGQNTLFSRNSSDQVSIGGSKAVDLVSDVQVGYSVVSGVNAARLSMVAAAINSANTLQSVSGGLVTYGRLSVATSSQEAVLTVNGDILAEEIKVQLDVPGPDYVFQPDYDLKSLQEVAEYIEANRHLPDVPPAKEMESQGINLGQMDMILLRKIEELTLYQIELLQELESMRAEIGRLRSQLEE